MLACLVLIPLAALFGTKLPHIVEEFRGGGWRAATESARQAFSEAPPFRPAATQQMAVHSPDGSPPDPTNGFLPAPPDRFQPAPAWSTDSAGSAPSGYPLEGAATGPGYGAEGSPPPRIPVRRTPLREPPPPPAFSATTLPANDREAMLASYEFRVDPVLPGPAGNQPPRQGLAPSSPDTSFWGRPTSDQPAGGPGPAESAATFDRFTYIQRRLRQLGATYYLLESWGAEGEYFRFHCRMAVGGNEKYTRHFEATEADALEAMARVLSEVETWCDGW
jgi:hypothetical protein